MMAWMNRESLIKTIETGKTWFWSRSRKKLWMKGETSGHVQIVKNIAFDCDCRYLAYTTLNRLVPHAMRAINHASLGLWDPMARTWQLPRKD